MGLMVCLLLPLERFLSSFNVLLCASMRSKAPDGDGSWLGLMKAMACTIVPGELTPQHI